MTDFTIFSFLLDVKTKNKGEGKCVVVMLKNCKLPSAALLKWNREESYDVLLGAQNIPSAANPIVINKIFF